MTQSRHLASFWCCTREAGYQALLKGSRDAKMPRHGPEADMRRRQFLRGLGSAAISWPLVAMRGGTSGPRRGIPARFGVSGLDLNPLQRRAGAFGYFGMSAIGP